MQHAGMRAGGDLAEQGRLRIGGSECLRGGPVVRIGQQIVRQMEGERRLADADGTGKDQRMRQLAGAIGSGQHGSRLFVAKQMRVFGRLRHFVERVVLFGGKAFEHQASALARLPLAACASRAANTASVTAFSTVSGGCAASISRQRSGSLAAMAR